MSEQHQKYHILIPVSLLPLLVQFENNPPNISGFTISRMGYLISTILTHRQEDHEYSYSILNMELLKNIVPRSNEYLNLLKQKDIIQWKNYSAGRNSRLYRFTKQYHGPTVWRTLTDQYLIRRIQENFKKMKFRNSKKYPQLNKYVHLVEIDAEAALRTIEETYQRRINNPDSEIRRKAEGRRIYSRSEVNKILHDQIYIKVNKTNFRYDTNFTRLPSELVKHLSIGGSPLLEFDIVNSQPFFAAALFDPTPEIQKIMGKSLYMYTKNLHISDKQDVKQYVSLVTRGNYYEYLMKEFSNQGLVYADRKDFKEQLFTVYFGRNSAKKYSLAVRLFESSFPNVQRFFEIIKEKQHNRLAIVLQIIESYTMLDCVAQKMIIEFPGLPFITKHDSILVPEIRWKDKLEELEKMIIESIEQVVGHKPKLKRK